MPSNEQPPPSALLGAYLAGAHAGSRAQPAPVPPPAPPPSRPPTLWIVVGVLALACAALAGALLAGGRTEAPMPVAAAAIAAAAAAPGYTPAAAPPFKTAPQPLPVVTAEVPAKDELEDPAVTYPYTTPSLPPGTWFVVLGGARGAPDARMVAVERELVASGVNVQRIVSDGYPNLNPGLVVLVEGPTTQAAARARLRLLRDIAPDAYAKSGW